MSEPERRHLTRGRDLLGLGVFVALCAAVSGLGGAVTATSVDTWYQALEKPAFNPPDWLFPVVWTILYIMIAIAGWRVWRRTPIDVTWPALSVFAVQLGLNFGWSFLFFGLQKIGLALAEIVVLFLSIAANAVIFWRIDRWAAALLAPYLVWVAYAGVLNAALWALNAN
jgi:tryptophan-rich sensory protein